MLSYLAQENMKSLDELFPVNSFRRSMTKRFEAKKVFETLDINQVPLVDSSSGSIRIYEESSRINLRIKDKISIPNIQDIPPFWIPYVENDYYFHVHDFCQISYIEKGKILYFVNNKNIEVCEGESILINAQSPHTWFAAEGTIIITLSLYPSIITIEPYSKNYSHGLDLLYGGQFPTVVFKRDMPGTIRTALLINQIFDEDHERGLAYQKIIVMKLFELSIIAMRDVLRFPFANEEESHKHLVLEKAFNFISENFQYDIGLDAVAKHVNMNSSYFSHYFKKNIGISFVRYLKLTRLSKSIEKLLTNEDTVTAIAFDCGFSSVSTYYQFFKSIYSISPHKYKKIYLGMSKNSIPR